MLERLDAGPAGHGVARLVRGRPQDPPWVRPTLVALLAGTAPTLARFQADMAAGRVHFVLGGGGLGGAATTASEITSWVTRTFSATSVGGSIVYDLTAPRLS